MIKSSERRHLNEEWKKERPTREPVKGRPIYYLTEEYYRVSPSRCEEIGETNWKEMVSDSPAFCYKECDVGERY